MKMDVEEDFSLDDEFFAEGETSEPPSMDLVKIEETFGNVLNDPQAIRNLVREKYVPAALRAAHRAICTPFKGNSLAWAIKYWLPGNQLINMGCR